MKIESLCKRGDSTFEFEDSEHSYWKVTVHAICLRRGNRSF
jgi:hypothetical protein